VLDKKAYGFNCWCW